MANTWNRTITFTKETQSELDVIRESIASESDSATIRYCIRQIYKQLQQESA